MSRTDRGPRCCAVPVEYDACGRPWNVMSGRLHVCESAEDRPKPLIDQIRAAVERCRACGDDVLVLATREGLVAFDVVQHRHKPALAQAPARSAALPARREPEPAARPLKLLD